MEVILNDQTIITQAVTVAELLAERMPEAKGIAVAVGTSVVPRGEWTNTPLTDQCIITVIRATRGG